MYLISTGKTTVLSDFANLETKSIYQHVNGEITDFQFYPRQRIFVEVNKKSGLEILRIKDNPQTLVPEIQRVRKLTVENVYCIACAKQSLDEIALGLSNGQVKLYNYKKAKIEHRFKADNIRNSVLSLDYNASDEYIASVFESGQINIYGMTTRARVDTINIDGTSTLARFHPTKRFHLSVASYKGNVTVYDVNVKRKIFNSIDSHAAPCRDLCMSAGAPHTLISVGYDCIINIFDTRRKMQPLQLNYCCPLSAVAMTDCGNYICVGNLKGELTTIDMRNTKKCLVTRKVHDQCVVTRIAFVPLLGGEIGDDERVSFSSSGDNRSIDNNLPSDDKSVVAVSAASSTPAALAATRAQRDSFCDFLDFQANKGTERMSSRFSTRRDSFDWDALTHKQPPPRNSSSSDENRASLLRIGSGLSSIGSANNSAASGGGSDSFDNKLFNTSDYVNTEKCLQNKVAVGQKNALAPAVPLRDRNNSGKLSQRLSDKLMQIQEEQPLPNQNAISNSDSDKENPPVPPPMDLELGSRLRIHSANVAASGTPNRTPSSMESFLTPNRFSSPKPSLPAPSVPMIVATGVVEKGATSMSNDIAQQFADMRAEMNTRFRQLEMELKFQAETNKWQIFTQSLHIWNQQIDNTEEIRDCLGLLLQTDPFVQEFLRMSEENRMLKAQLEQALEK